jgi:Uma2 family endonuclease
VAAPLRDDAPFDPLVDLAGLWTTELAERYVPLHGLPPATRYECLGGRLIMSPMEGAANRYAMGRMLVLLDGPAMGADALVYPSVNMRFDDQTWIEPDLAVLRASAQQAVWVPADLFLMPVEFVSPGSRRRDRIDKPALCAAAEVPYYLRVEIDGRYVEVELSELVDGAYRVIAQAVSGQEFRTEVPFPLSFDPLDLLEPGIARR